MADYAVDICKIVPRIKGVDFSDEIAPIWDLVDIINNMIKYLLKHLLMEMIMQPMRFVAWMTKLMLYIKVCLI